MIDAWLLCWFSLELDSELLVIRAAIICCTTHCPLHERLQWRQPKCRMMHLPKRCAVWDHWQVFLKSTMSSSDGNESEMTLIAWKKTCSWKGTVKPLHFRRYVFFIHATLTEKWFESIVYKSTLPRFHRMSFTTFWKPCKLLVIPATIFYPNMFFVKTPKILMDAGYCSCWSFVKAPLITKEEGKLWPHNETALQMRDKVGTVVGLEKVVSLICL